MTDKSIEQKRSVNKCAAKKTSAARFSPQNNPVKKTKCVKVLTFNTEEWDDFDRFCRISSCFADIIGRNKCKKCQFKQDRLISKHLRVWKKLQEETGKIISR